MAADRPEFPRQFSFSSSDPVEVRAFLDQAYGGRLEIRAWRDPAWSLATKQVATPQVTVGRVRMPTDLTYRMDGRDELVIGTPRSGTIEYTAPGLDERMGRGQAYVGNHPGLHCMAHARSLDAESITLPISLIDQSAEDARPGRSGDWTFTSIRASPAGSLRWRRATRLIDGLLADPETAMAPLIMGPAARFLAAWVIAIFPNTAMSEPPDAGQRDAHPRTLRRAIAFVDSNPGSDISLADIARAAHVTPRTIQQAFRRHLDMTPTEYVRQVRLHHAHQELTHVVAGDGTTVARVAVDWGFAHPGRFAGYYRAVYGRSPSETLDG